MKISPNVIKSFCCDVDALTKSFRHARRFTLTTPAVDEWVVLVIGGTPALVQITESDGEYCTGRVRAIFDTNNLKEEMVLKGQYHKANSEWHYVDTQQGQGQVVMADDYRQCIIDMVKASSLLQYFDRLRWGLRSNNASMNLFLFDCTGESLLKEVTTINDSLTFVKKKAEMLYFIGLIANVVMLGAVAYSGIGFPQILLNIGCTLYSLYVWYNDVRQQKRYQKRFDKNWAIKKQEYKKLYDTATRYGLSDSRIKAINTWLLETRNMLSEHLAEDLMPYPQAYCIRAMFATKKLGMEEMSDKQQDGLDNVWSMINDYVNDIDKFYKHTDKS